MVRDPQNLCRTTRHHIQWSDEPPKYPGPQNCNNNMLKYLNNRCHWLSPFSQNKTRVRNHDWHAFSIIIMLWFYKIIREVKKIVSTFTSVVVIMTTKKIAGPPDPLSWWSCGPLLIKVCVKPWNVSSLLGAPVSRYRQKATTRVAAFDNHWQKMTLVCNQFTLLTWGCILVHC